MKNKIVTFGEVLLRLAAPDHVRLVEAASFGATFGGSEANVAVSLAGFGLVVEHVTRLPENDLGDAALRTLRRHGVGTDHLLRGGRRLGLYFLEAGAVQRASRVIYDRARSAFAEIEPGMVDWDAVLDGVTWFHWTGITPALSAGAARVCLEAVRAAGEKGLTVSTDLNYRGQLWTWGDPEEVMPELVAECDVIVGNEEDADRFFGLRPPGLDVPGREIDGRAYETVGRRLMERFPRCRKVAITLRESISASDNRWSGVLWDGSELREAAAYRITPIVDRVGAGDAFAAGLIYGQLRWPEDDQRALDFAVAASCLKHTIPGDVNLVRVAEVEKLMDGDASGRVSR